MNQYTFNLETDYLQHDKFGAHYSKNWDKKKQDEYNAWYYKTHKDKWKDINEEKLDIARGNKNNIRFYNEEAAEARKEGLAGDKGHYPGYASQQKELARDYKQSARDIITGSRVYDTDPSTLNYDDRHARYSYEKRFGYKYDFINDEVKRIQKDRSKGINMVKFDIDRAKKKVSSALNKLKNIKL